MGRKKNTRSVYFYFVLLIALAQFPIPFAFVPNDIPQVRQCKNILHSEQIDDENLLEKASILDSFTTDQGDEEMWKELKDLLGEISIFPRTTKSETIDHIGDAQAVFSSKVVIDETIMEACPQLKYIGVLATGYNMVDLEAARRKGIAVTNIPAYSTPSVVQMVFSYILNDCVGLQTHLDGVRDGKWQQSSDFCYFEFPMREISAQTLVLIGSGGIGSAVGQVAAAFGMEVIFATLPGRRIPEQKIFDFNAEFLPLEEALRKADIISLHCPLALGTEKLVDDEFLSMVKPETLLINTARGPMVDEDAVCRALNKGVLRAIYSDVLTIEPPPTSPSNPLLSHPKAYVTPHVAWGTLETRKRLVKGTVNNVKSFLKGEKLNRLD